MGTVATALTRWLVCLLAVTSLGPSVARAAPRPGRTPWPQLATRPAVRPATRPAARPAAPPATRPVQRPAPATRPSTAPAAAAADNAATLYRQALAMLPQDQKHADMAVIMPADENPRIDDAAVAVIQKYDAAVKLLRRGAASPRCDWGLDRSKGPDLEIPHLQPARTMSQLVTLRARHGAHQKQGAEACEDAAALMAFGRHIGQEPFSICKLIESAVVASGTEAAALVLMHAPPEALTRLEGRLGKLPASLTMAEALKGEATVMAGWLRSQEKADPATLFQSGGKLWAMAGGARGDPNALETLKQRWADPQARSADIAAITPLAETAGAVLSAPPDQTQPALQAHQAKLQAAGPLAALVVPSDPTRLKRSEDEAIARLALLRAAIAVRLKGPTALAAVRDPFGNGPFTHKATPGGFELSSALQSYGQPVKLTVGSAP